MFKFPPDSGTHPPLDSAHPSFRGSLDPVTSAAKADFSFCFTAGMNACSTPCNDASMWRMASAGVGMHQFVACSPRTSAAEADSSSSFCRRHKCLLHPV